MSSPKLVRRFESQAIRPLWLAALIAAGGAGWTRHWWSLAVAIVVMLCLGVIGATLHPALSASDLMEGPLSGPAAIVEERALAPQVQLYLIGRACTHLCFVLAIAGMWATMGWFGWRWFIALPAVWLIVLLVGGFLKYRFVLSHMRAATSGGADVSKRDDG